MIIEKLETGSQKECIVFNIQKYSIHDGPGIRTTVFLKGCPLNCIWCSNPESQELKSQVTFNSSRCIGCNSCIVSCLVRAISLDSLFIRKIDYKKCTGCDKCVQICPAGALQKVGRLMTAREVLAEVIKDRIFYRKTNGGVTISGGEPFYQYDCFMGLLEEFKAAFLNVAVETTGYTSWENLERALPLIDLILYDFKHINSRKHRLYTGVDDSLIIENLKKLGETDVQIWLRMPIISGYNDSLEDIENTNDLIKNIKNIQKVELLPYHKLGISKYPRLGRLYKLKKLEPPSEQRLKEIESIFKTKLPWLEVQIGG